MSAYRDLHEHLAALEKAGLLLRVQREINKDTELHPLVRWQYRGGIPEEQRKAWLFENVVDAKGKKYDFPVAVGVLAGSTAIYALGMQCAPEDMAGKWERALAHPIPPILVEQGACQQVVATGKELEGEGCGLDRFPVPISTPGFDNGPYSTCSQWFTKDPETGIQNVGNYRGQMRSRTRAGIYVLKYHDFWRHWHKAKAMGKPLEAALVIGGAPYVSYAAVQPIPYGVDELAVSGGLAGEPIPVVRCKTVDIKVPASAEIVIEGLIPTDSMEPEGPFGESYGYVQLKNMQPYLNVTCITHRRDAMWVSFISQVTPSESSKIKEVGYEPMLTRHLRDECSIPSVVRVAMHEPLVNLRPYVVIQFHQPDQSDVWRAMYALIGRYNDIGKFVVAVDEDIDPKDPESVNWALCYRMQPETDLIVVPGRQLSSKWRTLVPESYRNKDTLSAVLMNATLKCALPPISLPAREYMERAKAIWEELGLPPLKPKMPWYGYSLGNWADELAQEAELAVRGDYELIGEKLVKERKSV